MMEVIKDYHSEIEAKQGKEIHVIPHTNNSKDIYGTNSNDYNSNDAQTLREASTSMMNGEHSVVNIQTTFLYKKDNSSRNKIFTPRSNLGNKSPQGSRFRDEEFYN